MPQHFNAAVREGGTQVGFQGRVHILTKGKQEEIGVDKFKRRVGGGEGVMEMGGFAQAAVLQRADEAQVGVFVEKRQGGEPWILENGDERFAGGWHQDLSQPHDGHQWGTERMGDDREIRGFAGLAKGVQKGRILARDGDRGSDHFAAGGGIGNDPPRGLGGEDRRVFENRSGIDNGGIPQVGKRGRIVQFRLEFGGCEFVGDVEDHAERSGAIRACLAEELRQQRFEFGGIVQDFLGERRALAPATLFGVEEEGGNMRTIRTNVQLEIQLKRALIPGGITRTGGIAQD